MKGKKAFVLLALFFLAFQVIGVLGGCGNAAGREIEPGGNGSLQDRDVDISDSLSYEKSMELSYARQFAVDYYEDGYVLISVADGRSYLIVPKEKEAPSDLSEDIVVLQLPLDNIYLVASAVMDMFCELDRLDAVRFSGQKAESWCIKGARECMERGEILYAGKYNMPDYELIVSEGCSLAVENNMISHSPEVVEKLEEFGIPVLIDLSSYEDHPLGRVEWVKLYGVLLENGKAAENAFNEQVRILQQMTGKQPSQATVAFFYITANGMANVRVSADYVPKMIELAGGKYIFSDLGEEGSHRSSITMQMEEFYQRAKDADYLIYNSTVDGELSSIDELLQKEPLLKDFKAVREGRVFCTTRNLYQQSMSIGQMIGDLNHMLMGDGCQNSMEYLYPLP